MTKPRAKAKESPGPEISLIGEQTPDEVLAILWRIARDAEESATARVNACRLLLMDLRGRDDAVESRHEADLNKRALALMRQVPN